MNEHSHPTAGVYLRVAAVLLAGIYLWAFEPFEA